MERIIKSVDYDYIALQKNIKALCCRNECLNSFSIGKSCAGRDITAIALGKSDEYVLFTAAFHGSEHITSNILLMFLEEIAYAYSKEKFLAGVRVKKALGNRGLLFVPRVNPDGCEISIHGEAACGNAAERIRRLCGEKFKNWNANIRGVDINHNFDAGWVKLHTLEREMGIVGPAPTRYGGPHPNSEPETMSLIGLCSEYNIHHAIALHSQGEVIYWSYNGLEDRRAKQMAEIMATTSGYALDVPIGIATGGGFKDWFIEKYLRPGFTVEVGHGKNPLPITDAAKIYSDIREMLTICSIM